MEQEDRMKAQPGSVVDPSYAKGTYFSDAQRHSTDAAFKVKNFLKLFLRVIKSEGLSARSFVDIGCGSGDIIKGLADSLKKSGFDSTSFKGYDVSPHVLNIKKEGVEYIHGDFCETNEQVDVVTLFDVFEHVPDTIEFLKCIAEHCNVVGLHIPLDHSLNYAMRNLFRSKLQNPGHLLFLDAVSALNLLALSGLRVVDYEYTFSFLAPSGHKTPLQKFLFPLRYLLAKISPWLLSKTFGGASLMVVAITPRGLREQTKFKAEA